MTFNYNCKTNKQANKPTIISITEILAIFRIPVSPILFRPLFICDILIYVL